MATSKFHGRKAFDRIANPAALARSPHKNSKSKPGAVAKTQGGALFKAWRLKHGYTQFAAAHVLGLTYNKINRWENSHMFPSLPLAVTIERVTGIPPRAWLEPVIPTRAEAARAARGDSSP